MKTIKYKGIFFVIILFTIFLFGCQTPNEGGNEEIDKTFTLNNFVLEDNIYKTTISNETDFIVLKDEITVTDTEAKVNFYSDEERLEIVGDVVDLNEGDNYFYGEITFSDESSAQITINVYRLRVFTVKFETKCSTSIESLIVEENTIISAPTDEITKKGHYLNGWTYDFSKPVTSDLTIVAKWKANTYTITYDTQGGEIETPTSTVTYGEEYELLTPTKEGFVFVGWRYNNRDVVSEKWSIAEDATLVAVWEVETRTYEIEYIIVGAVGSNLQRTYTNKEHVILRTPYKCGYRFVGWYKEVDLSGERVYEIPVGTEGNLRFFSKWEKVDITKLSISFLGDSITTFYKEGSEVNSLYSGHNQFYYPLYSSGENKVDTVDKTWWYQTYKKLGSKLLVNDSISGSCCYNWGNEDSTVAGMNYHRINNLKDSDIVVIFLGTNDLVNGFTNEKFENAYKTMIKRIKEVAPDCFIFCCTLGYSVYTGYNYTEAGRIEFNNIIRNVAKESDATVIEFSEIQTEETYKSYLGDRLHPNTIGMTAYAEKAYEVIKNYIV